MNTHAQRYLIGVVAVCLVGCSTPSKTQDGPWSLRLEPNHVLDTRVGGIVSFTLLVMGDQAKPVTWEYDDVPAWLTVHEGGDMLRVTGLAPSGADAQSPIELSFVAIGANGERRTFGPIELRIGPPLARTNGWPQSPPVAIRRKERSHG